MARDDGPGGRRAAPRPPLGADGLVGGAPGARDLPLAMTPDAGRREGGVRRQDAGRGDGARPGGRWAGRVEEQGPFLAPDPPAPGTRRPER